MIYLDTSALLKLYFLEEESNQVQELVVSQQDPLPIWEIQEMELTNAFQLNVFWKNITAKEADFLHQQYLDRKARGLYYVPDIDRNALLQQYHRFCRHSAELGCRSLDILHVAAASLLKPDIFVSFDERQCQLAAKIGLILHS